MLKLSLIWNRLSNFWQDFFRTYLLFNPVTLQCQNTIMVSVICTADGHMSSRHCPGTVPHQAAAQLGQCTSSALASAPWEAPQEGGPQQGWHLQSSPATASSAVCSNRVLLLQLIKTISRLCLKTEYCSCNFYVCFHNWMRWEKPINLPYF